MIQTEVMKMLDEKRKRLEEKGWKVGSTQDFLGLTKEESEYIDLKIALSTSLKKYRFEKKLTQFELAKLLKSSQSRIAKMEAGSSSVSLDLIIRSLFALGATKTDLANLIVQQSI